jgi:hypothetical protein
MEESFPMSTYASTKRIMLVMGMMGILMINVSSAAVLTVAATDDTKLVGTAGNQNLNYGASNSLWVQYTASALNTSLLRFDLSSLAGASISNVTLDLYLTATASSGTTYVGAYALSSANYGWVEGTGNGTSVAGASTYNEMLSGSTVWPGGQNGATTGTYGSGYLVYKGFTTSTAINAYYTFNIYNSGVASEWLTHGSAEILLETITSNSARVDFASSEAGLSFAPILSVTYTVPEPGTGALVLLSMLLGVFAYRWRGAHLV